MHYDRDQQSVKHAMVLWLVGLHKHASQQETFARPQGQIGAPVPIVECCQSFLMDSAKATICPNTAASPQPWFINLKSTEDMLFVIHFTSDNLSIVS